MTVTSSAITTYNETPYYDDFDSLRNYLRILFRPGYPVQARELTQIQTILQNQIGHFADHVFEDGSMVIPGSISINPKVPYVKIESYFVFDGNEYFTGSASTGSTNAYYQHFIGRTIVGQTSGVRAKVIDALPEDGIDNPYTLYVIYTDTSGTPDYNTLFFPGEILLSDDPDSAGELTQLTAQVKTEQNDPIGFGMQSSIQDGVYYTRKSFVYCPKQTKIVSRYVSTSDLRTQSYPNSLDLNFRIILRVIENILDEGDDDSILDPSQGTPNYNAPGATRYNIELELNSDTLTDSQYSNYIELVRFENGLLTYRRQETTYSQIEKILAKRTFEESGDYFLAPFALQLREHYNDGTNNGVYTAINGGLESKIAVGLEPSTAYCKGHRINKTAIEYIAVNKARSYDAENAVRTQANLGQYVLVTNCVSIPDIHTYSIVQFYNGSSPENILGVGRARAFEYHSGTKGTTSAVYKLYLFDIKVREGYSLSDTRTIVQTNNWTSSGIPGFSCELSEDVWLLYDTEHDTPIYQLPYSAIRSLLPENAGDPVDTSYVVSAIAFSNHIYESGGLFYIEFSVPQNQFLYNPSSWILCASGGGSAQGKIIDYTDVTISSSGLTTTVYIDPTDIEESGALLTEDDIFQTIDCVYRVIKDPQSPAQRNKTLITNYQCEPQIVPNLYSTTTYDLPVSDCVEIISVRMSSGFTVDATSSSPNVTDHYDLIQNSTSSKDFYGVDSIRLKPGKAAPTGKLLVTVNYYSHSSSGGDIITVDSYTQGGINYVDIPTFSTLELSDCYDNRPRKGYTEYTLTNSATIPAQTDTFTVLESYALQPGFHIISPHFPKGTTILDIEISSSPEVHTIICSNVSTNTAEQVLVTTKFINTGFGATGAVPLKTIAPNTLIQSDITYYLPRIDMVYLNRTGEFGTITGIASRNPVAPSFPKTGMALYQLYIPAYTRNIQDIAYKMFDYKRYTMKDIGRLDDRLKTIEYYTSLSMIEKSVDELQLFDSTGDVRYKNGFATDDFYNFSLAHLGHVDHTATIHSIDGILHPAKTAHRLWLEPYWPTEIGQDYFNDTTFNLTASGLPVAVSMNNGTKLHSNKIVTLDYTTEIFYDQPTATTYEAVNQNTIYVWKGILDISPSVDDWCELESLTSIRLAGKIVSSLLSENNLTSLDDLVVDLPRYGVDFTKVTREDLLRNLQKFYQTGQITAEELSKIRDQFDLYVNRTNEYLSLPEESSNLGEKLVSQSVTPYCQSREIRFHGVQLRPFARIYVFIDGENYTDRTISLTESNYKSPAQANTYSQRYGQYYINNGHPEGSIANLITNEYGEIFGSIFIPSSKLLSGIRQIRLSDSSFGDTLSETTFCLAQFHSRAKKPINTTDLGILTTKTLEDSTLSESNLLTIKNDRDCVAQTFMVNTRGGIFLAGVDLYFESIDDSAPISISISPIDVEQDIPLSLVYPSAERTLTIDNILNQFNLGRSAVTPEVIDKNEFNRLSTVYKVNVPISFVFDSPIYLFEGREYCVKVNTLSDEYKFFVSEFGQPDIAQQNSFPVVSPDAFKQRFFRSSNVVSAWKEVSQSKNLKYRLHSCNFGDVSGEIQLVPRSRIDVLDELCLETTTGSRNVKVYHRNHGFRNNEYVTISGITANDTGNSKYNGIPLTELNKIHAISLVEEDSYTITASTTAATSTGVSTQYSVEASASTRMDEFFLYSSHLVVDSTWIDASLESTSTSSLYGGTETPYQSVSGQPIELNQVKKFVVPQCIMSRDNEIQYLNSRRSMKTTLSLNTDLSNLSPVLDLDSQYCIAIHNRITNGTNGYFSNYQNEMTPYNSSGLSKYITKEIQLSQPAAALHCILQCSIPAGASFELYYKTKTVGDSMNFDDIPWKLKSNSLTSQQTTGLLEDFSEIEFAISEDDMGNEDQLFSSFGFKVVMYAESTTKVPTFKNFRFIAVT